MTMRAPSLLAVARWTTLVGVLLAVVVVGAMAVTTLRPEPPATSDSVAAPRLPAEVVPERSPATRTTTPDRPGRPVAVRLPSLGVRASVVAVDLATDGTLTPPADPRLVGWWRGGARPGSNRGPAVLTGHTVHDGGGVFDDLAALQVGDTAEVVTDRRALEFTVRSVRDLEKADLAARAGRLFSPAGAPDLVLVTCTDWDGESYLGNTVVVARSR
jgi:LPXTG-site transpeptidase (sortase) family protein